VANRDKVDEVRAVLAVPKRYDEARIDPLNRAAIRPIDINPLLKKRIPIMAILGRQDYRFVGDAGYLRSKGIPVTIIDNCGHFPYVEQPERFHTALRKMLTRGATAAHA